MQEEERPSAEQGSEQEKQDSPSPAEPSSFMEVEVLSGTIAADLTTNIKFIRSHFKITLWLLFIVIFLQMLPSPLIIKTFQNDPTAFTKQVCSDDGCESQNQGYESIIIKKINPLHRELKYFVKLNQDKIAELNTELGRSNFDLNEEITWIEIFASRNNQIYGEVLYEKSGADAYEVLFNNEPLIYMGEVHILREVSYLIRIYKLIHTYKVNPNRMLDETEPNFSQQSNTTVNNNNKTTDGNKTEEKVPKQDQKSKEQQKPKQPIIKEISVPLTVELVRYSQFYTGTELLIRYVTFLFILYVRAQTASCPKLFQAIIFFTANPLIFTEIAFPNTASNILSSMCSSMYIFYIPLFLFYTHRPNPNYKLDLAVKILKMLCSLGLYIASVVRSLHLMNQTFVETLQYLLIVVIIIPIIQYLWRIYFVRSKVVLHRNMLFVVLTIYYFSLLFFSGYIVQYGWKKISFYLIVQAYGISLCYLTTPKNYQEIPPPPVTSALSPNIPQGQNLSLQSQNANSMQVQASQSKEKHSEEQQLQGYLVHIK